MSTILEAAPRPIGPQREGIRLLDAPRLHNGWTLRCDVCQCSVGPDHSVDSCREVRRDRFFDRRD